MKKIALFVNRLLAIFGLRIQKINPINTPIIQTMGLVRYARINTVFDIGANTGQFSESLRLYGYKDLIVSFEPLSSAHGQLKKKIIKLNDKKWILYEPCGIGSKKSIKVINISQNSYSSSFLDMNKVHLMSAPDSLYVNKETVRVIPLKSVDINLSKKNRILLKIDTQGYEKEVLDGVGYLWQYIYAIHIELSIEELYSGQSKFDEIYSLITKKGFKLWTFQQGFLGKNHQSLQLDGLFIKADL